MDIHVAKLKRIFMFLVITILFACCSSTKSEKVKLGFEWNDLQGYEYDVETGKEYLTFRYIPPERYDNEVTDYDWVYICVDVGDYQPVERTKRLENETSHMDLQQMEDAGIFPFWEDDMRLQDVKDSPNGSKSIIMVSIPELESVHPYSRRTLRFLRDGDEYTQIVDEPFPHSAAYGKDIGFATNKLVCNMGNPLYIYDTDAKQWFFALPEDSKYHATSFKTKSLWINDREFLTILEDKNEKNYAARIDCLSQSIVTLIPLKGDVRYSAWSEKKIGALWYQPHQTFGKSLYHIDMGIVLDENENPY